MDMSAGIIKDVLFTATAEIGQGFHNNLYGLAVDLNIPHTPVAQINYYIRNEIGEGKDLGSQVTLVWLTPFSLGSVDFAFEGFLITPSVWIMLRITLLPHRVCWWM